MALKLDQIKKRKTPQRRSEGAVSFVKERTLAPFEIPQPQNIEPDVESLKSKNRNSLNSAK